MDKILLWSLLLIFSGSQASRPLAQRNMEFAVDLYQAICLSHKNNIIFSPLGTTLGLGMVQLGAKGKAQEQIRQTLKLQETTAGEEFSVLKSFFSAISEKKQEFTFNLANALYLQEGFTVKEQYLHSNKAFLQSAIKLVDFQDAKTSAETISTWVESKTDGYFSESSMNYQVLELPYKGDEFSLIIVLPAEDVNIEEMEKQITAHQILKWFSEMQEDEVEVGLPRFKVEQKLDFKEALYSLNITEIFSGGCDLSGITDSAEVFVSQVMQHVFFEINEDGSEAATSTGMHIPVIMSLAQNKFIANHPFLFIVKNNPTESILFMGRVTNPDTQKMKGRDLDSL
ncbi:serpin I2 isoform X2 [Callorhinus ursinus]|uniref:serpin I2 isoform X2 n=1 Tax=Callorhinus ursinus TaxID=34884 RepID=UPI003CCFFC2C